MVQDAGAVPTCPWGMTPQAKKPITLPPKKRTFLQGTTMVIGSTEEEGDEGEATRNKRKSVVLEEIESQEAPLRYT